MTGYEIQSLSDQTNYNLSPRNGTPVRYIVVHYTGGTGSAKNNVVYFSGGNRGASADYFIDDTSIWRFNPDPRKWFSWHCGDGGGRYGITNSNSIGIEVVSDGRDFSSAEIDRLAWLVQRLMAEHGIDRSRVVRHYDASRKLCPAPYIDAAKWQALKERITTEEDDLNSEQNGWLKEIHSQVTKTADPSGRGKKYNDHDHLKWMAAKQAQMDERQQRIEEKLDALLAGMK